MQPTVSPAPELAHRGLNLHLHQHVPHQHAQPPVAPVAAGGTAAGAAAMSRQRQQWEARLASFQRGLDHVMRCDAGDACGSSLCHATKRLMRSYATHDCTNPPGYSVTTTTRKTAANPNPANECKVCKLWGYILTKNKSRGAAAARAGLATTSTTTSPTTSPTISPQSPPLRWHSPPLGVSPSPSSPPVLPPLSCGLAHARAQAGGGIIGGGGTGAGIGGAIGGGIGGGIGGIDRFARDARGARGASGLMSSAVPPRRRVVVTPELVKFMCKRV